jgi:hypothetical protein
MLWVYASVDLLSAHKQALEELPSGYVDLRKLSSDMLSNAVRDFCDHHRTGHIYLGFLDPLLMLHPIQETLLRRGFQQCNVSIVVSNPYLLPFSWKNGIQRLVVVSSTNVNINDTKTVNDGSTPHLQNEVEHRQVVDGTTDQSCVDQGGKTRSVTKRRKQARQNQAAKS